jgi:hypothetical protein
MIASQVVVTGSRAPDGPVRWSKSGGRDLNVDVLDADAAHRAVVDNAHRAGIDRRASRTLPFRAADDAGDRLWREFYCGRVFGRTSGRVNRRRIGPH